MVGTYLPASFRLESMYVGTEESSRSNFNFSYQRFDGIVKSSLVQFGSIQGSFSFVGSERGFLYGSIDNPNVLESIPVQGDHEGTINQGVGVQLSDGPGKVG